MSFFNKDSLISSLLILASCLHSAKAINAYIYYTDATCIDSETISGTFNLAYDSSSLQGFGLSDDHNGECIYFTNGYIDISSGYSNIASSMVNGYCVECNGVVGCSSTQDSCDDIKTIVTTSLYQMSSSNEVQGSNQYQSTDAASGESETPAYQNARDVQKEAMMKLDYGSQGTGQSSIMYAVLGGFVGLLTLVSLVAIFEGARQWRVKRERMQAASIITESFAPDGAFA